MAKEDVVNKLAKGASVAKATAQNEAKRLEEKVKAYNNSVKNNNQINNQINTTKTGLNNNQSVDKKQNNKTMKEKLAKKAASAALQYIGVPKGASDKAIDFAQSEKGKKMLKAMEKTPIGNKVKLANRLLNSNTGSKNKSVENSGDGGYESSAETDKIIKYGMYACIAFAPLLLFILLFMTSVQVFLNSISLGEADSLTIQEAESKINKKEKDGYNEEITDDNISYDKYIDDSNSISFRNNKLNNFNVVQVVDEVTYLKRKYNEAKLEDLEDFYPGIEDLSKNYDKNMVYDFFFKMYNLNQTYSNKYGINLDLPLLMSTLNQQSQDKYVIFSSNLGPEDRKPIARKLPIKEFDYHHDWINSGYMISKNNSEHDMEILAQNMVSKQTKEKCVDSSNKVTKENILRDSEIGSQTLTCEEDEFYETEDLGYKIDHEKYKEFLRQFIEKKYYLDGEHPIEPVVLNNNTTENSNIRPATGDYRNWTQCGQSWSSIIVPNSNKTMCEIGCLITSVTIQIARSGTAITTDTIDPGIALKKYKFATGGNFYWNSTINLAPNFSYLTNINFVGMNKKSIAEKLNSYDPNRYYIILAVSKKDKTSIHHYVALDYVDNLNNNIYIMDPSSVAYTDLYDLYKLYKAYIYEKKD